MQMSLENIHRRTLVRLIFIVYWLLIFEGALRKWLLPGLHQIIFFVRDPLVLWIYILAILYHFRPKPAALFWYGILLGFAISIGSIAQYFLLPEIRVLVMLYGLRTYFFYFPLVFLMGSILRYEDIKRWVRLNLFLVIPMTILVVMQYYSPPAALINRTISEVVYTDTGKGGGTIVRTIGTFTFFHGHQLFLGSMFLFCLANWTLPSKDRALSGFWLYATSAGVAIMLCLDFTRAPIYMACCILLGACLSSFWLSNIRQKIAASILPIMLAIACLALSWLCFPDAAELRIARFLYCDDTITRTVGVVAEFVEVLQLARDAPLGYGIGTTSRGGTALGGQAFRWAGENEWRRIISEIGPFFGILYIALRVWLLLWLLKGAIRAVRCYNHPWPLLFIAYIGPIVAVWYINTIGSVHGYGWFFAGICCALNHQTLGKASSNGVSYKWTIAAKASLSPMSFR